MGGDDYVLITITATKIQSEKHYHEETTLILFITKRFPCDMGNGVVDQLNDFGAQNKLSVALSQTSIAFAEFPFFYKIISRHDSLLNSFYMKSTKLFSMAYSIAIAIIVVNIGCTKEKLDYGYQPPPQPPPAVNTRPQVSAGANIQLLLPADSCILTGAVTATGSKIKSYLWVKTSGPAAYTIEHPDSLVTKVRALQVGTYTFQLTVTDSSGLTGKASVSVIVTASVAFEYDLNLDIHTGYRFFNNEELCPWDCYYADLTTIDAAVAMPPNIMKVWVSEETDSAAHAYNVYYGFTGFRFSNQLYASGPSSFNLKKTIQQGGGSFSSSIQLNSSSAIGTWRENAFKALPPLTVTGKLDTTTRTVNMQIKGKIIF